MAGKGRRYARDRQGRFSSTGATARGGRLTTAKGKAYSTVRTRGPAAGMAGTIKPGKRKAAITASNPASGIRKTGGLSRIQPSNNVARTAGDRRGPLALKSNAIRTYKPVTAAGGEAAFVRRVGKTVDSVKTKVKDWKGVKSTAGDILRKLGRSDANTWAKRSEKGIKGDMARIESSQFTGKMIKGARETIQRRAQRAADVAKRGKPVGAKAAGIYDRQLAFTGPGKTKAAKNTIKPGPSNTNPPKRRRKRKGT